MSSMLPSRVRRESPLASRNPNEPTLWPWGDIRIFERAFLGHINLRGDPETARFMEDTTKALGFRLPLTPNTVREAAERAAFWLAPNEWLIVCPDEEEQELAADLRVALSGQFISVVELAGGQTVLRLIGGTGVRDLLAKGCPLDLDLRVFRVGDCAQSHLAQAPVLLRPVRDGMEIVVRRSFADYLWQWLDAAGPITRDQTPSYVVKRAPA